jgi:hypothetical protein
MVTVPSIVPDVPALRADPVVAYMTDLFTKPVPFQPDIVFDVTPFLSEIVGMLACHACQFFDWLPFNMRMEDQLPHDEAGRLEWLTNLYRRRAQAVADRFRDALIATYGREVGSKILCAEGYEISEYASQPDAAARKRLFNWLP